MDGPYLFISYSRIQFYFVEALAHQLRTHKVPYWFDVEKLEIGKDWQSGIDSGLANCQALVLVVSNASLGSPNVKYEWEAAQKANKPVYLALFEAVDIPSELSSVPIIDFRGNFNDGIQALAELFRQGASTATVNDAPRPNRFHLPTRLPRDILIVVLTLLLASVASAIAALMFAPVTFSAVPVFLVVAVGYGNFCWHFARRQYVHSEISSIFVLSIVMASTVILTFVLLPGGSLGLHLLSQWEITLLLILFGIALVGSAYSLSALMYSPAIFRWTPLGQIPPRLRDHALHITRKRYAAFTELGKTYSLSYAPGDERVGTHIRRAMAKAFYTEVPVEQAAADHNLIVLSNTTPLALFEAHSNQLKKPVSVVASSIRSATPDEKELRAVTRFQWLDYRERQHSKLKDMTEILWLGDNNQPVAEADYHVVPESFGEPIVPTSVYLIVNLWRLLAAGAGSLYLAQLIGALLPAGNFLHQVAPRSLDAALLTLLEIPLALILLWLCVLVTQRSINFTLSLLGFVVNILLNIVIPLLILQNTFVTSVANVVEQISTFNQPVVVAVSTAFVLLIVAITALYIWGVVGLYRWLPISNERPFSQNEVTLRQPFGRKLWRNNLLFAVVLGSGLLAITQVTVDLALRNEQIDHLQITVPRIVTSMPVQNNDIRTITGNLSSNLRDRIQQYSSQVSFGPLLWVGAYDPDQTTPIVMFIWRYQPAPDSNLSPPDQAENMVDQFVKSAASVPSISNVIETKIMNADTLVDGVTYDIAGSAGTNTIWTLVARAKQFSYFIVIIGDQQPMLTANLALSRMTNSIVVN